MKKILFTIFLAVIVLCSCSKKENTENLEFPKTAWGMSIEETFDALGISKEDTSLYEQAGKGTVFVINNYEVFGEKASEIIFNFIDFANNDTMALCDIKVHYSENTDMNQVLKEMQKLYGKTVPEITTYDLYQVFDELTEKNYAESDQLKIWAADSIKDWIPEEESEDYRELWESFQPKLTKDTWDSFLQNSRMTTVLWMDTKEEKTLHLNAYNLLVYQELKKQLSK